MRALIILSFLVMSCNLVTKEIHHITVYDTVKVEKDSMTPFSGIVVENKYSTFIKRGDSCDIRFELDMGESKTIICGDTLLIIRDNDTTYINTGKDELRL